MRQTITSMLGTLPPQFFRVVISTEAENLAQVRVYWQAGKLVVAAAICLLSACLPACSAQPC
jgi:hypothetical protein